MKNHRILEFKTLAKKGGQREKKAGGEKGKKLSPVITLPVVAIELLSTSFLISSIGSAV